mgnify:CR=1 FL=1
MLFEKCEHIYKTMGIKLCPKCNRETHEVDWEKQNLLNKQWLKDNPLAYKQVGWWSI